MRRIRLVVMHHVALHAVKQGYQFADTRIVRARYARCVLGPYFRSIQK